MGFFNWLDEALPINALWWAVRVVPVALLLAGAGWLLYQSWSGGQSPPGRPAVVQQRPTPAPSAQPSTSSQPALGSADSAFADQVIALTNQERIANGCPSLRRNELLTQSAQYHTIAMAEQDFFDHVGADGSQLSDRVLAAGYDYTMVAENIAAGLRTPAEVVAGWMDSPGHRRNILNCELREIGVGFYEISPDPGSYSYRFYWTQNFGTRP